MSEVFASEAKDHLCPFQFNDGSHCSGPKCMAWRWAGQTHERCETDNLIETPEGPRPEGAPPVPDGDGWEMDGNSFTKGYHRSEKDKLPKATAQRWIRQLEQTKGFCGRIGPSNDYMPF